MMNLQDTSKDSATMKGSNEITPRTPPYHMGKWTREEEEYVAVLIEAFKAGVVPISEGTTLRVFLCSMLNCPAKRISKKFVGTHYNGKQPFTKREVNPKVVSRHHQKLRSCEEKFIQSLAPIIDFQEFAKREEERASAISIEGRPSNSSPSPPPALISAVQLPVEKLESRSTNSAVVGQTENLTHALQADSLRRLAEIRTISDELAARLATSVSATPTLQPERPTNTQPVGGNNNDLILALLGQKSLPTGLPPLPRPVLPTGGPPNDVLLETLKRTLQSSSEQLDRHGPTRQDALLETLKRTLRSSIQQSDAHGPSIAKRARKY